MTGGLRIDHYDWTGADGAGGREALLRFGPDDGPRVILALPLFEEANRTRAFAVTLLRALAVRGIGGVLPDLPGQGESLIATANARLSTMEAAYAAFADAADFAIGIRSGALIDRAAAVRRRWHLSPVEGADFVRELRRAVDPVSGDIAGNTVSDVMMAELSQASSHGDRVVRLDGDPRAADRSVAAAPLWRRTEPGNDPRLADLLAEDIAEWIASCGG